MPCRVDRDGAPVASGFCQSSAVLAASRRPFCPQGNTRRGPAEMPQWPDRSI